MSKFVKLSENANIFHDPYSQVTLAKGEVKELSASQLAHKRVRQALSAGHLEYAEPPKEEAVVDVAKKEPKKELTAEELEAKLLELVTSKEKPASIKKKFNLEQLKTLAIHLGFEIEESDTKESLLESILEEDKFKTE